GGRTLVGLALPPGAVPPPLFLPPIPPGVRWPVVATPSGAPSDVRNAIGTRWPCSTRRPVLPRSALPESAHAVRQDLAELPGSVPISPEGARSVRASGRCRWYHFAARGRWAPLRA